MFSHSTFTEKKRAIFKGEKDGGIIDHSIVAAFAEDCDGARPARNRALYPVRDGGRSPFLILSLLGFASKKRCGGKKQAKTLTGWRSFVGDRCQ